MGISGAMPSRIDAVVRRVRTLIMEDLMYITEQRAGIVASPDIAFALAMAKGREVEAEG